VTLRVSLIIIAGILVLLSMPVGVSAHQSGCHRWHSCPSDTGSYVCGDLGYYSQCPTTGGTDTGPDYTAQGTTNGQSQAENDTSAIQAAATTDGGQAGKSDGESGNSDDPSPDPSTTCDKTFTFSTPQVQEYIDAFHDSYLETCTDIYNAAFETAYESAFQTAESAQNLSDTAANSKAVSSDNSGYWILGVLGVLGGIAGYNKLRKK
jgi:hypothetical protein